MDSVNFAFDRHKPLDVTYYIGSLEIGFDLALSVN